MQWIIGIVYSLCFLLSQKISLHVFFTILLTFYIFFNIKYKLNYFKGDSAKSYNIIQLNFSHFRWHELSYNP